jgi:hypothetical protein
MSTRRRHWSFCKWSYTQLWAAPWCWQQNSGPLEEEPMLWAAESFSQTPLFLFMRLFSKTEVHCAPHSCLELTRIVLPQHPAYSCREKAACRYCGYRCSPSKVSDRNCSLNKPSCSPSYVRQSIFSVLCNKTNSPSTVACEVAGARSKHWPSVLLNACIHWIADRLSDKKALPN